MTESTTVHASIAERLECSFVATALPVRPSGTEDVWYCSVHDHSSGYYDALPYEPIEGLPPCDCEDAGFKDALAGEWCTHQVAHLEQRYNGALSTVERVAVKMGREASDRTGLH